MKNYELLCILPSNMSGGEIKTAFLEIEKNILELGGKKLETLLDHPFLAKAETSKENAEELKGLPIIKRRLAYPIRKNRTGFYCLFNFSNKPNNIKEIDNYLKMNNAVIRHLIIQSGPITKEKIQLLEKLFARKKAEQEKQEKQEKAERKEKKGGIIPKKKGAELASKEKTKEVKEVEKIKEIKEEEKPKKEKEVKEKKKEKKPGEVKEKTTAKKKKIKLEDLEEKLDEILEDTSII